MIIGVPVAGRQKRLNEKKLFNKKILDSAKNELNREKVRERFNYLESNFLEVDVESAITNGEDPHQQVGGVEENVKNNLVLELLESLGWKRQKGEVTWEDTVDRGNVDIALKLDGNPHVYVEIKTWKKDLVTRKSFNKYESPVDQALQYAQKNGVPWVLITNGYEYRLYKTYIEGENTAEYSEVFTLDSLEDEENFAELYALLSRDRIDKISELFDKTRLRLKNIDEHVLDTLLECRTKLVKDIYENNDLEDSEALKEDAQRILDRILFIRYAEDNGFFSEDTLLKNHYERWKEDTVMGRDLSAVLNDIFRYVDDGNKSEFDGYNGELFKEHECEDLTISDDVLEYIIDRVYQDDKGDRLDFSEINADIVGTVYEKYLGWALDVKDEGITEESDPSERKNLGQYYTPPYVVNFIIEETLGRYFEENKLSQDELSQLNLLDPACGSGAFLIKSYDKLREFYTALFEEEREKGRESEGKEMWDSFISESQLSHFNELILKDNIHGVDLNQEAIEISKMNLWFKSMQKERKLNELDHNLKVGNSVVEDEEIAGESAFNWEEGFKDVFKSNGGFDLIIGNPPYIKYHNIPSDQRDYFKEEYTTPKYKFDIYIVFIEKCIDLLAEGGRFSFIVPGTYMNANYGNQLREKILDECTIEHIVDFSQFKVFEDASVPNPSIFVLKKGKEDSNEVTIHTDISSPHDFVTDSYNQYHINQEFFQRTPRKTFRYKNNVSEELVEVIDRVEENSKKMEEICYTIPGVETGINPVFIADRKLTENHKPLQAGDEVSRYQSEKPEEYIWYVDSVYLEGEESVKWVENKFDCPECNSSTEVVKEEDGGYIDFTIKCQNCGKTIEVEAQTNMPYDNEEFKKEKIRDSHYKLVSEELRIAEINLKRPRTQKFFESPKVFTQKVAGDRGLISTRGKSSVYALDSLNVSVLKKHLLEDEELNINQNEASLSENYTEEEVLAVINSKLINFYFKFLQSEDLNVYPRDINALPLKKDINSGVTELVEELEENYQKISELETDIDNFLSKKPVVDHISLEELIEVSNVTIEETLDDSSQEAKIKDFWAEGGREEGKPYDNNIIIKVENGEEGGFLVLRVKVRDPAMSEFLKAYINSLDDDLGKGNVLKKILDIELPVFSEEWSENRQILMDLLSAFVENRNEEQNIQEDINEIEAKLDAEIFDSYGLEEKMVEEVLNSLNLPKKEKKMIRDEFRSLN